MPRDDSLAPPTLIRHLLIRQFTCDPGFGLCPNDRCCPLTSNCCNGGGCCGFGSFCYSTGCCNDGETGCGSGCCRFGDHCCSDGDCCHDSEYCTTVDGHKGCCPLGRICTGTPPPPTTHAPPPPTTHAPPPPTTHAPPPPTTHATPPPTTAPPPPPTTPVPPPPLTSSPSSTSPSSTLSSTPQTSSVSAPPSTPSSGTNVTISATDPGIVYTGSWTIISATCSSVDPAKQCKGSGNSMTYTFTGTAIYLTIGQNSNSGVYTILFDGVTVTLDAYSSSTRACNISWYRVDLAYAQYTVIISSNGTSPQAPSTSTGTFEFVNFVVSRQTNGTSGGSTHSSSGSSIGSNPAESSVTALSGSSWTAESGVKLLPYTSAIIGLMLYWL